MPLWLLDNQIMVTRNRGMKLLNQELRDLYFTPSILVMKSDRMCLTGHVRKPKGQRRLRKPRHRWGDNTKMGLNLLAPEFYI
jgi:hypothetical protein